MFHLLQRMTLKTHVVTTQGPQFTLGFAVNVVDFMGLDKGIATRIHHRGIRQNFSLEAWRIVLETIEEENIKHPAKRSQEIEQKKSSVFFFSMTVSQRMHVK